MNPVEGASWESWMAHSAVQAPPPPVARQPKAKKTLSEKLRDDCWRLHFGVNVKRATCLFCCVNELSFVDKAGWQAGHCVPEKFFTDQPLNVYDLVPICNACNSSMGTTNAFDYLWDTFKVKSLKTICTTIYDAFAQRNEEHMGVTFERCMWKLISRLFGSDQHMAGGGITCANESAIYLTLQMHQMDLLRAEICNHMKQVSDKSAQMEALIGNKFQPSKRARLFA